jgi:hypothetical protein
MKRSQRRIYTAAAASLALTLICAIAGPALAKTKTIERTVRTQVRFSATKNADESVTGTISLLSSNQRCLDFERVAAPTPISPEFLRGEAPRAEFGYGGELTGHRASAGHPPWVWEGTWPGSQTTSVVADPGQSPYTSTVSAASFLLLRTSLLFQKFTYRQGKTKVVHTCPSQQKHLWVPL